MVTRRVFLAGLAATAAIPASAAPGGHRRLYLGARADGAGNAYVTVFAGDGHSLLDHPIPARGHGFAVAPGGRTAVAFARRPGRFAVVFDLEAMAVVNEIPTAADRHFNGHGTFSADGRWLFGVETDYAGERGVVGIYDARNGFRRVDEVESGGLDPHNIWVMPDQETLVVANGGLLTHPSVPGGKFNIPTMDPSLAYLESASGRLIAQHRLPRDQHTLGIRHLSVRADSTVGIALQSEGPSTDAVPVAAVHRPGGDITLLSAPEADLRAMRNYGGDAVFDSSGTILAVSCPRGNRTTFWNVDAAPNAAYLGSVPVADGCGVSAAGKARSFVLSSGRGGLYAVQAPGRPVEPLPGDSTPSAMWDNHMVGA